MTDDSRRPAPSPISDRPADASQAHCPPTDGQGNTETMQDRASEDKTAPTIRTDGGTPRIALSGNEFHLVTVNGERTVYEAEADAIDHLRGRDIDPDTEDVNLVAVTVTGGDWKIRELPWQRIALQLLGGDGE